MNAPDFKQHFNTFYILFRNCDGAALCVVFVVYSSLTFNSLSYKTRFSYGLLTDTLVSLLVNLNNFIMYLYNIYLYFNITNSSFYCKPLASINTSSLIMFLGIKICELSLLNFNKLNIIFWIFFQ